MLKRLALVAALLAASISGVSAQTDKPKSTLYSEAIQQIPDNQSNLVTPANVRNVFNDVIASAQQAPQVNPQTGVSYAFLVTDYGNLVTFNNVSAVAVTLPQAIGSFSPWNVYVRNLGSGTVTITPQGGSTIGGASSLALPTNATAFIVSDGTNYQIVNASTNGSLANMAARTLKGNLTPFNAPPQDIPNSEVANVSVYGYGASGSTQSTTGTIGASSPSLALASALDFVNGQGIRVTHAGVAATNVGTPTAPSVSNVGSAGGTTYTYQVASFDPAGGVGIATTTFQTTTGNATLNTTNYNSLTWTAPSPAPAGYAIWRGSTFIGLTANSGSNSFADQGQTAPVTPDWIPATAPAAALPDSLLTTISSGGGTTGLTLAANATTAASGTAINHDDSAAIQACLNASATNAAIRCYAPGVFNIGAQLVWPSTGSVGLVGAGRGWFAAGPPANVGLPGTKLIATQNVFCVVCAASGSFTNGNYLAHLTIDGNTIATEPLDIALWGSSTVYNINVLNALGGGTDFQLGHSGANPIENTILAVRVDNPLMAHNVPNLPTYSCEVGATNNNIAHLKCVNSKIANIHTVSGVSFNNTFHGVHGYNYDYSIAAATAPTNNFLIEGTADQFTSWEADGSSSVNVQINGFSNLISGGVSQFQSPLTAEIGVRFATSTCLNSVINNQIANSSAANTIVQAGTPCAGENLVWQNFNNTNNTVSGLTSDIVGHIRTGAGGAAAPTLTSGCTAGTGATIRSDSTDFSGQVTGGTSAATSCVITFAQSFLTTVPPRCVVSGQTVAPTTVVPTASTLTINFSSTSSAVFNWVCVGI